MVSLLTPAPDVDALRAGPEAEEFPPPAAVPTRGGRAAKARHRRPRGRFDPFPFDPIARWILRVAFAAPYALLAVVFHASSMGASTGNGALLARLSYFPYGHTGIADLAAFYPPVSSLLATVIPGKSFGLALAGAVVVGFFLQKMLEIMVQREMPRTTIALLLVALAANPLLAYMAVGNIAVLLGLAFFGVGLSHLVRFVMWGSTQSGFMAGLLFMVAALCDASAVLYVLTAAAAAPFLRWSRSGQRGVRRASVFVLLFPTISAFGAILVLEVLFGIDPFAALHPLVVGAPARAETLVTEFLPSVNGLLLAAPVLGAWTIGIVVRRPGAILASTLVFAAVLFGFCFGLVPSSSAGSTFVLMMLLAIALIPRAGRGYATWLVNLVAVLQVAVAWETAINREILSRWLAAMAEGAARLFG